MATPITIYSTYRLNATMLSGVKFSHDPLTYGYSLGAPLGFHRLHRNAYVIVGVTSFFFAKK